MLHVRRCQAWFACFFEAANHPAEQMNGMNGMQQPQQPMCLGNTILEIGWVSSFASLGAQVTWQSCWLMNAGFLHMLPQCHDVILQRLPNFDWQQQKKRGIKVCYQQTWKLKDSIQDWYQHGNRFAETNFWFLPMIHFESYAQEIEMPSESDHFPQANAKSRLRNASIVTRKSWMDATCNSPWIKAAQVGPTQHLYPQSAKIKFPFWMEVVVVHDIFCEMSLLSKFKKMDGLGGERWFGNVVAQCCACGCTFFV